MKAAPGHCASQARRRRCTNATLLCGAQTVSRRFVNTSPGGKRPWPRSGFESRKSNCFRLLLAFPLSYHPPPPFFPLILFKSEVSKNMASYSACYNSEEEKREKKLYHPVGLIEGISDALGVRHSSSSFLHWRLYKQVSNAPDLVWQTFSKEHLKRGWESDTPTCAFSVCFFFGGGDAGRIRSPLTLLLFNHCHCSPSLFLSLSFAFSFLLWQVSCGPLNCTRNGGKSRKKTQNKDRILNRALSRIQFINVAEVQ